MGDCCVQAGNLEWHALTVISVVNALMMTVMIELAIFVANDDNDGGD